MGCPELDFRYFDEDNVFIENNIEILKKTPKKCRSKLCSVKYHQNLVVFRRPHVGNNPVNRVDPTGMTEADVRRAVQIVNPYIDLSNTSIVYADLPGDTVGMGFPATPITPPTILLDNSVLNELDSFEREQLLNTVHHEGTHTQEAWADIFADSFAPQNFPGPTTERHYNIYVDSNNFSSSNAGFMNTTGPVNRCGY